MKKCSAALFDVDGTLISLDAVVKAIQETCEQLDLRVLSKEEIYEGIIGIPLKKAIKKFFPFTEEQAEEFDNLYHENYITRHVSKLLPTVKETLQVLKDKKIKIGIITTKSKRTGLQSIKDNNIPHDVIVTQEDVKKVKPSPEPILKALKELGVKPEQAVMVGDHVFDVQSAKNAGCAAVGVTTGARSEKELREAGADFVISELKELLELFEWTPL